MLKIMIPASAVSVAFFAERLPLAADSIAQRALGSTEIALIRLAEVLAKRGHRITVFTGHENPPPSNPSYVNARGILKHEPFDVVVCVQEWKPAVLGIPGKRIFYWTADGAEQFANYGFGDKRAAGKIEYFLAASAWHAESLCRKSGFPRAKTAVIGNGVHLDCFQGEEERARKRLICTTAPYRGLELVPALYTVLKEKHPDAELWICSPSGKEERDRSLQGPFAAPYAQLKECLQKLPACCLSDSVPQPAFARELMKSSVFIYPNTVFETCCITALEAQAAGCPIVASANSALPETVGDAGFLISGEPGSEHYRRAFVQACDRLLTDDVLWEKLSLSAKKRIKDCCTWDAVAERFEALL